MPITDGDSVTIEYVGKLTDGTVFDTSDQELAQETGLTEEHPEREFEPLTVEVGSGSVIPGIEDALTGLEAGDSEIIRVPPEKAYGEYREDRVGEYDRDEFDKMLRSQELREGVEVQTEGGLPGEVVDVGQETVTVDFNHDLAGETLEFEIRVVDVS
jgi:peptidylprolyl isomerase